MKNLLYTLPIVNCLNNDPDVTFDVGVWEGEECGCEMADEVTVCTPNSKFYGDTDSHSPVFCEKHFRKLTGGKGCDSTLIAFDAVRPMLEACKLALAYIEQNGFGHNQSECCDALRASIAKATTYPDLA